MFFALCPGPFFSVEELLELLMVVASWGALLLLAVIVLAKWADARWKREAERCSLRLNDG